MVIETSLLNLRAITACLRQQVRNLIYNIFLHCSHTNFQLSFFLIWPSVKVSSFLCILSKDVDLFPQISGKTCDSKACGTSELTTPLHPDFSLSLSFPLPVTVVFTPVPWVLPLCLCHWLHWQSYILAQLLQLAILTCPVSIPIAFPWCSMKLLIS